MRHKWTKEEDNILIENYALLSKIELESLLPNISYISIMSRANRLGLKKNRRSSVKINLLPLLKDDINIFYWMGYFLADGSISIKNNLSFSSNSDPDHLKRIAEILETNVSKSFRKKRNCYEYSVSGGDSYIVPRIMEKFHLKYKKTYNPPDFWKWDFSDDFILSMFIGLIDGDGHVKFDPNGRHSTIMISMHKSWVDILSYFVTILETKLGYELKPAKINKKSQGFWSTCDTNVLVFLKKFIVEHNLPVLCRKWDNIDIDYKSRKTKGRENNELIYKLHRQGFSYREISKMVDRSYSYVSKLCLKYKNSLSISY